MANDFWAQYKHPNWQKRRLERLEYSGWECESCGTKDETLHVHHKQYFRGRKVWEYSDEELVVLCEGCHEEEHGVQTELKQLLTTTSSAQAFALLCGFNHKNENAEPALLYSGRDGDPLTYACGLVAFLTSFLSIKKMFQVAAFATSLTPPQSEARPIFEENRYVFGEED